MGGWLKNFAYRIRIPWQLSLLAEALAVFIALATVSFPAVRASLANPADAIRRE